MAILKLCDYKRKKANLQGIHILYIEDDLDDVYLIQSLLAENYFRTFHLKHALSLSVAQVLLRKNDYHLILLDLSVSGRPGLAALQETFELLRTDQVNIPIIILTGLCDEGFGEDAISMGAADYLPKAQVSHFNLSRSIRFALERHQLHQKLLTQARYDELTGLINRAETFRLCQQQLEHCQRSGSPLALGIIDLNNFKPINDTYGHLVGDEILRFLGARLRNNIRSTDIVGRIGGDEFLVLFTHFKNQTALKKMILDFKKIIEQPVECYSESNILKLHVSISIGVTLYQGRGSLKETMDIADKAMYASKANGGLLTFR